MNHHRRTTAKLGRLGAILAGGVLALVSVTGCGPAVSSASPILTATLAPSNVVGPTASTAAQTPTATPTPPSIAPAAGDVAAIAAGPGYTCAVTSVGGVKCWGLDSRGQLGSGSADHFGHPNPVDVVGLTSGVTAIAAGLDHACALTSGGGVECWGSNLYGTLGNGTTTDSSSPVEVAGLSSGVSAIAVAETHACAVTSAGGATCWGWNKYGTLGNGSTIDSHTPVDVTGLASGVAAIAVGQTHTCALTSRGRVKCWGLWEALGNGPSMIDSHTPVDVTGVGSGVTAIAAGAAHTCALTSGGGVKCWGLNARGQLGVASTNPLAGMTPVDVAGLKRGAIAIAAGETHTCALMSQGGVKCWGDNSYGQLGNGSTTSSRVPVGVTGLASGVTAITAGFAHTCALTSTGGAKCWGHNTAGELGNGSTTSSLTPVDVLISIP